MTPMSPYELRKMPDEDCPRWYRIARLDDGCLILESVPDAGFKPHDSWRFERLVTEDLAADASPDDVARLLKRALNARIKELLP